MRNKIRCFINIVDTIKNYYRDNGSPYPVHSKYYINTTSDEDHIVEFSRILNEFEFDKNSKSILFEYSGEKYISFICPFKVDQSTIAHFEALETNAGLWTFVVSSLCVDVLKDSSPIEIYDRILAVEDGTPEGFCQPIDFDLIKVYFPEIYTYKVDDGSFQHHNIAAKCMGYILSHSSEIKNSKGNSYALDYANLFESSSGYIPYDLVIHSLYSSHKKYTFIELYRCVEYLYPVPSTKKLINVLFSGGSYNPIIFAKTVEDEISWRPKEEDSLSKIIADLPEHLRSEGNNVVNSIASSDGCAIAKFIYRLRNSNVHFRSSLHVAARQMSDADWDSINSYILKVILSSYESYDSYLSI